MIYPAKDDNSDTKEWKAYSIDRLSTLDAEEKKLSVFIIRIGLPGP
jgi:hypothetical protein